MEFEKVSLIFIKPNAEYKISLLLMLFEKSKNELFWLILNRNSWELSWVGENDLIYRFIIYISFIFKYFPFI